MAAEKQSTKPVEAVIKNLNVNPSPKLGDANRALPKDGTPSEATSCISSSGDATGSVKEGDADHEPFMAERGMYYPAGSYYGYYYPGYDGSVGEWEDQGYYLGSDGMEIQYPTQAVQADNGSLIYYMPGMQPGYTPYNPYLTGTTTLGIDGQYLGQQPYLSTPMYQQPINSPGYYPTHLPYGSELVPSYLWDPSLLVGDGVHANSYSGVPAVPGSRPHFTAPSHTVTPPSKSSPPNKSNKPVEVKVSTPALDVSSGPGMLNQLKPVSKATVALAKGYFPMTKLPSSNQGKGGLLYPNSSIYKTNGRGWSGTEKQKEGNNNANRISDFDLLNEQNRGPRTNNNAKGTVVSVVTLAGSLVSEGNGNSNGSTAVIRRDQYNLPDFATKYDQALFFVIKSYSEDDIHKSIKYNVWASTPNGNKRLDSAYQNAQEKMHEKGSKCPVFLFFSVNASGQFCGIAEMVGRVDFNKNMDFWQQDKWNGFFPVKWHIIKDVPNPQFRHIILENNDNKPVTNSRDTQEVRFPQGSEMLNVFKSYMSKASILDDFNFYESRQKAMQDKRIRPATALVQLQKAEEILQLTTDLQSMDLNDVKKISLQSMDLNDVKKTKEELPVEDKDNKAKE